MRSMRYSPSPPSPNQPNLKRLFVASMTGDYIKKRDFSTETRPSGGVRAVLAPAEDLVAVPFRREADLAAGLFLDLLELGPADLLDAAAGDADEVVVVRPLDVELEARRAVARHDVVEDLALLEHLQGAKDRRAAQAMLAQGGVDLLLAEVRVGLQEVVEDAPALVGQPQAVARQILGEERVDLAGVSRPVRRGFRVKQELSVRRHARILTYFRSSIFL